MFFSEHSAECYWHGTSFLKTEPSFFVAGVVQIQTQDSSVHEQSQSLTHMTLTLMRCLQTVCALVMVWRHVTAHLKLSDLLLLLLLLLNTLLL